MCYKNVLRPGCDCAAAVNTLLFQRKAVIKRSNPLLFCRKIGLVKLSRLIREGDRMLIGMRLFGCLDLCFHFGL